MQSKADVTMSVFFQRSQLTLAAIKKIAPHIKATLQVERGARLIPWIKVNDKGEKSTKANNGTKQNSICHDRWGGMCIVDRWKGESCDGFSFNLPIIVKKNTRNGTAKSHTAGDGNKKLFPGITSDTDCNTLKKLRDKWTL